jgi:CheY-like chemotaxis protein
LLPDPYQYIMSLHNSILVAEDDDFQRHILQAAIKTINKTAYFKLFSSGEDILHYLDTLDKNQPPLLLVVDYHMPDLNGKETLQLIRARKTHHNIPAVVYSAVQISVLKAEFEDMDILAFVEKAHGVNKVIEQLKYFVDLLPKGADAFSKS